MKISASALALTIGLSGLSGLSGLTGLAAANPAQTATVDTVATADAHADGRRASANYGSTKVFMVDGRVGRTKQAFLKFTVPAVRSGEDIDTVALRLRSKVSSSQGISVYRTRTGWAEDTLTWTNKPSERTLLGSSDGLRSRTTEVIALNVGRVIPGQVLSLRVETSAQAALTFASAEGRVSTRPVLRVSTRTRATVPVPEEPPVTRPVTEDPPVTLPVPEEPPVTPSPDTSFPPAARVTAKVIGMSAPANLWDTRISEVVADGVKARRIFADLSASGSSQLPLIRRAIADGMIPVISYKAPNPATLANGGYDSWLATLRTQLNGLDAPVTATYWHEPHGDMTPAEFRAGSQRFLELVKAPNVAVGPILNGWLLDNLSATTRANFQDYTSPALLDAWDFVGVDSYQEGTASAPNSSLLPARAVPRLAAWLDAQGFPDKKIVLGEYNGFTAQAIAQAGEWILSTPELWIASVWNVDHTTFSALTGDRITAYQKTKADPRALR